MERENPMVLPIKSRFTLTTLSAISCLIFCTQVFAEDEESADVKIARAMSAAPTDISGDATIMDADGTVLREGSNGWTCMPGVALIPGDKHPMCNDAAWMGWLKAATEGQPFTTDVIGFSYMVMGDALVNNDNPGATDPNDGGTWVQEGPHLMILTPSTDALDGMSRDPYSGGPYVMWDNTPMVHIMVPLEIKSV
jgi:hypothetical protein